MSRNKSHKHYFHVSIAPAIDSAKNNSVHGGGVAVNLSESAMNA